MNKKLIGNLFLLALIIALGLSFIDLGKSNISHEGVVSDFIEEHLEPGTKYLGIKFEEVTEPFLLKKEEVKKPLATIEDSIYNQLSLLGEMYISLEFQNSLLKAQNQLKVLGLEAVDDYLVIDAEMKRAIKKAGGLDAVAKGRLYVEETRMFNAINELNAALGQFNLSVFGLDFEQTETLRLYHQYQLTDAAGSSDASAVFEIDRESKEVISFKEILTEG